MTLATLLVLHGGGRMELSYFWSAIVIVALPMTVFGGLAYFLWRGYRKDSQEHRAGSST
jgi:lipopolysaccharide export LptBFGC system permease protein LptF